LRKIKVIGGDRKTIFLRWRGNGEVKCAGPSSFIGKKPVSKKKGVEKGEKFLNCEGKKSLKVKHDRSLDKKKRGRSVE